VYSIKFYENEQGERPVRDYLKELGSKTDKDSRIKVNKIYDYIETLKEHGTRAGMPFVKHMDGDIWELRPFADRFFFFYWKDNQFVFLHYYHKKTNKTPPNELDQAKRNLKSFIERNGNNDK
jgi:phage-related protein